MDRRLQLIYDMVDSTDTIADVGTDHGYLICSLVADDKARRGVATDINKMPLESAESEIKKLGLSDRINTYLTDGLKDVEENIDSVIIAGMGGELIAKIIEDSVFSEHRDRTYYLQPMTKPQLLRKFLYDNGFIILEEKCVVAGNRPYSVIKARWTSEKNNYNLYDVYVGKISIKDSYSRDYIHKITEQLSKKLIGLSKDTESSGYLDYKELYDRLVNQFK